MSEETGARFAEAGEPDWSDRSAVIDHLVHLARASASSSRPFDEEPFRELAARVFDRTPVIPYGNGVALAREIPGAKLLTLQQTGHELPPAIWDVLVPAILEHTSRGE